MRILVATHQWFPDYTGGSARVATETARALAERGHELTVLAPRSATITAEAGEDDIDVRRVLTRSVAPQTLTDLLETFRHARKLDRSTFDVLLAHHPTTASGLLAARLDAPVVFVYHASVVREIRLLRAALRSVPRRAALYPTALTLELLERRTVHNAARLIVLSRSSRSLLRGDHPGADPRIRVTPGGVDSRAFAPSADRDSLRRRLGVGPKTPLILTARRLEPCLGLEKVVEAVAALGGVDAPVLAVAGDGPLAGELRRLGDRLGMDRRLRLLGVPESLGDWYAASDLFVMSPAPHEGFGMATVEALASGTPAVGAPLGATPEVLGPLEPGLVAGDGSADALASAVARALELADEPFRRRCREYAVERYSWEHAIDAWEQVLLEVVENAPAIRNRTR